MAEGVGAVEVQRGGNMAYQSLETLERKIYQERTYDANHNSNKVKEFAVSCTQLAWEIVSNTEANIGIQLLSMLLG